MKLISRRGFLKHTCVAAAALSLPEWVCVSQAGQTTTPSEADQILSIALSRGGQYADLFVETRTMTHITVADSEIKSIESGILQGGGVRTVLGEKTGYAYTESLDSEALAAAARTASAIAAVGGSGVSSVPVQEIEVARHVRAVEPIADTTIGEKIALLQRVDAAARAVSPAVNQVSVDYRDADQKFSIAHSGGQVVLDELPVIYLRVTVTASGKGQTAEGAYRLSARKGLELLAGEVPEMAGREAAEQAIRMLDAVPAPTGELPVVVAAGGGVMFHEAVGHGLEADAILREASVFAGRIGEKVASDLVTLYDDATVPGARGSFNVDDEGAPATKTLLIDKGVLVSYMYDRRTAYNMREATTANGRRQSFRYPAIVRMTNTYVAPGTDSAEEIIKSTKRGVYAVHFGGGEVDPGSGQFTFGLREAYLIEDGQVTSPIRGANLVGSGSDVLKKIDRVGSDFGVWPGTCGKGDQWVPVTSGCPTLRISGITVGGTA
jgi:TldD protein